MKNLSTKQIALSNFPYFRYSLDYALSSLERLGANAIEFYANDPHFHPDDCGAAEARALHRKMQDHGLNVICWCPEQVKYPINIASSNPYCRKRSMEYYIKSLTFAHELECPTAQFFAGWNLLDQDYDATWQRSVDALGYLADIAHGYGINITIEAADPLVTILTDTSKIKRMLSEVASPNLHGMLDLYCLGICNETIEDALQNLPGEIYHVHFSDAQYEGLSAHVIPGEGVLDLDHMLAKLDEANYTGYLSTELMTPYERMPEEALKKTLDWMIKKLS